MSLEAKTSSIQLLALTVTKNEGWVLGKTLSRLAECADAIIAVDDGSTDNTHEILGACPKVLKVIRNPPFRPWRPFRDAEKLMRIVHKVKPQWCMYVDSDDLLDARFAGQRDYYLSKPEVGRYYFREVSLWRSNRHYRVDRPERYNRPRHASPILVRYNERLRFGDPLRGNLKSRVLRSLARSYPAILMRRWLPPKSRDEVLALRGKAAAVCRVIWPPDYMDYTNVRMTGYVGREEELPFVRVHYHFVNWEMAWRKHVIYALNCALQQVRSPGEIPLIADRCTFALNEQGLQLAEVDPAWGVL